MLIEFTGVSCSGKSTVSRAMFDKLQAQGIYVKHIDVGGRYGMDLLATPWFLKYFLFNAKFCFFALRISLMSGDSFWTGLNLFRNFAKKIGVYGYLKRRAKRKGQCILWDEGSVHAAHNLFVHVNSSPGERSVKVFADLVPLPDMIVLVNATSEVLESRMRQRGHKRVGSSGEAVAKFVGHAQQTFKWLVDQPRIRQNLFVVDNDGGDVDLVIDEIVEHIPPVIIIGNKGD